MAQKGLIFTNLTHTADDSPQYMRFQAKNSLTLQLLCQSILDILTFKCYINVKVLT